jgi:nucleotide-binding universal stress UspA family protein
MDRNIVIGYDPERAGLDALLLGRDLSRALHAHPIVVMALPWPDYLMSHADLEREVEAATKPKFGVARDVLGSEAETRAVTGPSGSEALLACAEEVDAALVVVGSSHRGAVGRTLAGSTGESLMHGSPAAVAIAPAGYGDGDHGLRRLAVAYDGTPEAVAALDTAIGLARLTGAELTVLTVADYVNYGYSTAWSVFTTGEIEDAERKEKRRVLETALGRIPAELRSAGRLLVGAAGPELAEASPEFDLLIAGSRGYGPLRRTLLGSTSRQLIGNSGCPVLVLPRGAGDDPLGLASSGA